MSWSHTLSIKTCSENKNPLECNADATNEVNNYTAGIMLQHRATCAAVANMELIFQPRGVLGPGSVTCSTLSNMRLALKRLERDCERTVGTRCVIEQHWKSLLSHNS